MVRVRFHRGSLEDSMNTMFTAETWNDFEKELEHNGYTNGEITWHKYTNDGDSRVGWKELWIILYNGAAIAFADNDLNKLI